MAVFYCICRYWLYWPVLGQYLPCIGRYLPVLGRIGPVLAVLTGNGLYRSLYWPLPCPVPIPPLPGTHTPYPGTTTPHPPHYPGASVPPYTAVPWSRAVHQASFGLNTRGLADELVTIFGMAGKSDKNRLYCNPSLAKWLFLATFWHKTAILAVFRPFCTNIEKMHPRVWGAGLFDTRKCLKIRSFWSFW